MKKITLLLFTLLLGFNLVALAGGKDTKDGFVGTIKYKISAEGREITPAEQVGMPTEVIEYYYGGLTRKDIISPSSNIITISNKEKDEFILLLDVSGQKMYVKKSLKKMTELKEKGDTIKPQIKLYPATKTVAGYPCKKAKYSKGDNSITVFYSEKIKVDNEDFEDLPGCPLYYEIDIPNDDELSLVYSATEIITKKPKKKLFKIPSDYEEMPEAMQKQFGLAK